ncbi:MAG: hypothetical protein QMD21_02155 [Candidatus Thermoplasmatota archaeon]|nr:hypothetical protein [Candidatus Thermoplasmatota archaeon]
MKIEISLADLERVYGKYWWRKDQEELYNELCREPFKLLVFTILSQNTSSENTYRAYKGLSSKFSIDSATLAKASEKELAKCIKAGGLHNIKAERIKACSQYILNELNAELSEILKLPVDKAREELQKIPGVGSKTADVLLSNVYTSKEALVIDTHMRRLALRVGLVEKSASYEKIQKALTDSIPWNSIPKEKHERYVGLLWLLAKHTCGAIKPKCGDCSLRNMCKYASRVVRVL